MRLDLLQSYGWQVSLGRFGVLLVVALIAGWLSSEYAIAIAIAMGGYAVGTLVSLYRVQSWLLSRRRRAPPEDRGVWSDVATVVHRRLGADHARKRRLIAMLRAFREAAAALPDAVVALTQGRSIVWCNRAARTLLGLDPKRDRGRVLDASFEDPRYADWIAQRPDDEPLHDIAAPGRPDVRLSLRLISYARDQQLLVARDVTQLMRLEQVRRDFVANVSHELRTPLTVVHGYLELFEPEDAPDWAPRVAEMRTQSQRMLQIVEDLLTLSRLETHEELQRERVGMRALLSTLKREAEALSQGRHDVGLELDGAGDLYGSPKELHSAFSNLVSNAVRYTPAGGSVAIAWKACPDGACFSVRDTGYGIPPEHLPRITERFYRVSTSRSRETGGTGLGLAIVKHVLGRHGARLEIESAVGKGSTFSCRFDRASLAAG